MFLARTLHEIGKHQPEVAPSSQEGGFAGIGGCRRITTDQIDAIEDALKRDDTSALRHSVADIRGLTVNPIRGRLEARDCQGHLTIAIPLTAAQRLASNQIDTSTSQAASE
jgi:hypothetical protein